MSYSSSYSGGVSSSSSYAASSDGGSYSSSNDVEITIAASSPDDSDGLAAAAGADALAAGEDTLSMASVSGEISDEGAVTVADLSASALSAAEAPADQTAFTSADTFIALSDGAELAITYTGQNESATENATGSTSISTSTTHVTAADIDLSYSGGASSTYDGNANAPVPETEGPATEDEAGGLDGNVALADFDVAAIGENTFAEVDAFVLAVEDELSISTVSAVLAVD